MEKYLVLSVDEYEQRAAKARRLMVEQGIDACIFSKAANIVYFSGYLTTLYDSDFRPFLFVLPVNGEPVLIVPDLELGGAQKTSWVDDVRVWGDSNRCVAADPITLLADVLKELKLDTGKVGMELGNGQRLGMTMGIDVFYSLIQFSSPRMRFTNKDPTCYIRIVAFITAAKVHDNHIAFFHYHLIGSIRIHHIISV